jgi:hypothetical protein
LIHTCRNRSGPVANHIDSETYRAYERLADQLSLMPDVIARLLVGHDDDGTGYCAECRRGGTGTATVEHPCSLYQLALMALAVRKRRKLVVSRAVLPTTGS